MSLAEWEARRAAERRAGTAACRRDHFAAWRVLTRNGNCSAFNGYRWADSAYSSLVCDKGAGGCGRVWRTDAAYVADLPPAGSGVPS
jgi:hypothetical protein